VRYLVRNRQKAYWSNTFASSQILKALTNFQAVQEDTNFTYTVSLDRELLASGSVVSFYDKIPTVKIDPAKIKEGGSTLNIETEGTGNLYSTLLINEHRTTTTETARNSGLVIKKWFEDAQINKTGVSQEKRLIIAEGDIVNVNFEITGLDVREKYAVISDELPSNLIPVNTSFDNEALTRIESNRGWTTTYPGTRSGGSVEITKNGANIYLSEIGPGTTRYSYKARAIVPGEARVPPAHVELMYLPEVSGRSDTQVLNTYDKEEAEKLEKTLAEKIGKRLPGLAGFIEGKSLADVVTGVITALVITAIVVLLALRLHKVTLAQALTEAKNFLGRLGGKIRFRLASLKNVKVRERFSRKEKKQDTDLEDNLRDKTESKEADSDNTKS
jgi:hypothetical protein